MTAIIQSDSRDRRFSVPGVQSFSAEPGSSGPRSLSAKLAAVRERLSGDIGAYERRILTAVGSAIDGEDIAAVAHRVSAPVAVTKSWVRLFERGGLAEVAFHVTTGLEDAARLPEFDLSPLDGIKPYLLAGVWQYVEALRDVRSGVPLVEVALMTGISQKDLAATIGEKRGKGSYITARAVHIAAILKALSSEADDDESGDIARAGVEGLAEAVAGKAAKVLLTGLLAVIGQVPFYNACRERGLSPAALMSVVETFVEGGFRSLLTPDILSDGPAEAARSPAPPLPQQKSVAAVAPSAVAAPRTEAAPKTGGKRAYRRSSRSARATAFEDAVSRLRPDYDAARVSELLVMARRGVTSAKLRVVMLAYEGHPYAAIRNTEDISEDCAARWIAAFNEGGVAGLNAAPAT